MATVKSLKWYILRVPALNQKKTIPTTVSGTNKINKQTKCIPNITTMCPEVVVLRHEILIFRA